MKIVLIFGVIIICVLGFLLFLWKISKEQVKNPIEQMKQSEKNSLDFIKQRQALYQKDREVQRVSLLSSENRGALFERAIERKKNQYIDDDKEYQNRLDKRQLQENPSEEFKPLKHPISSFVKKEPEIIQEITSKESTLEEGEDKEIGVQNQINIEQKEETERSFRNQSLTENYQKKKQQIANYQKQRELEIEKFREEVLLEIDNIRKRRKALVEQEI